MENKAKFTFAFENSEMASSKEFPNPSFQLFIPAM